VLAFLGAVLGLFYTVFLWYAALKGLFEVDTFNAILFKETPTRKMQRAENLTLRERVFILFGSNDLFEIMDTWGYGSRSLPLTGLEWTFLQCEGGITTSDEEDDGDESETLL